MAKKFIGTFCRALDVKGRLLLPPPFLYALSQEEGVIGSFWLTSLYGRLTAYLPGPWEEMVEKLCAIGQPSRKLADFKTKLIGLAQEIIPDGQGRIRIPQSLMREGGLHKEVVLVGLLDKFEVWDQGRFDSVIIDDVSDELASRGITLSF